MPAGAASLSNKELRGTKRTCPSCAVRFYDLGRDPAVCPACATSYTPEAEPVPILAYTEKPARRAKPFKYSPPAAAAPAEPADAPEPEATEEIEEAASTEPDDDVILEDEPDDANVEDLIEHDIVEEPKDR
jgi:hypothetical protein